MSEYWDFVLAALACALLFGPVCYSMYSLGERRLAMEDRRAAWDLERTAQYQKAAELLLPRSRDRPKHSGRASRVLSEEEATLGFLGRIPFRIDKHANKLYTVHWHDVRISQRDQRPPQITRAEAEELALKTASLVRHYADRLDQFAHGEIDFIVDPVEDYPFTESITCD